MPSSPETEWQIEVRPGEIHVFYEEKLAKEFVESIRVQWDGVGQYAFSVRRVIRHKPYDDKDAVNMAMMRAVTFLLNKR